jgi:hypothetical protein
MYPFGGPGGDLLSRALRRSTIGPGGLNDRVRNGIGWGTPGIATRSAERIREDIIVYVIPGFIPGTGVALQSARHEFY